MMQCSAVKAALAAWDPEGTRDLPDEVVEHLDTCPGCRGAFDRVAGPVVIDESARVMPVDVRMRVRAAIAKEVERKPAWRWLWALLLGGGSLAAVTAVAAVAIAFVVVGSGDLVETTHLGVRGAPTQANQDEVYEENNWIKGPVNIPATGTKKSASGASPAKAKSASEPTATTTQSATAGVPEVPAAPTGTAPLGIKLNGGSAQYIRISCTDGYVQKIKLSSDSTATAYDAPIGEDCKVSLEGGGDIASYNRALAGRSYDCDVEPPQLICRSAPASKGPISIKLIGSMPASGFTVACPDGFRGKASMLGGEATVADVPRNQACAITFQGGAVAKFSNARAGNTYTCELKPPVADCK